MKQCIAETKQREQCRRPAAPNCGDYCRQHYDDLPTGRARSIARGIKVRRVLKKAGLFLGAGIGIADAARTIIEVVGPYLKKEDIEYVQKNIGSNDVRKRMEVVSVLNVGFAKPRGNGRVKFSAAQRPSGFAFKREAQKVVPLVVTLKIPGK